MISKGYSEDSILSSYKLNFRIFTGVSADDDGFFHIVHYYFPFFFVEIRFESLYVKRHDVSLFNFQLKRLSFQMWFSCAIIFEILIVENLRLIDEILLGWTLLVSLFIGSKVFHKFEKLNGFLLEFLMLKYSLGHLQVVDHLMNSFVVVADVSLLNELSHQIRKWNAKLIINGLFVKEILFIVFVILLVNESFEICFELDVFI